MKKLSMLVAFVAALAVGVAPASSVVIKTKWIEKSPASWGGSYTLYVREIRVTKTTWRARVGIVNRTAETMNIRYGPEREGARTILRHGPGIWFSGPAAPGSTVIAPRHVDATTMRPALPHTLRRGKSWFGAIEGPTAKLPKDRLLRIGFGWIQRGEVQYPTEISTTHQFRLPRRLS